MSLRHILTFWLLSLSVMALLATQPVVQKERVREIVGKITEEPKVPECLIKNIYHEARGEPFEGMIAVAQVTYNRAKDGDICKAVYANKQFSWTANERPMRDKRAIEVAMEAAKIVQQGKADLFLDSALMRADHYHADYVRPYWSRKIRQVAVVGRHIFYATESAGI